MSERQPGPEGPQRKTTDRDLATASELEPAVPGRIGGLGNRAIAPGKATVVGRAAPSPAGQLASVMRSALGALGQLRARFLPELEAAAQERRVLSPMIALDARSALRRAEEALAQARQVGGAVPAVDWTRACSERDELRGRAVALLAIQDELATPASLHEALVADVEARTPGALGAGAEARTPEALGTDLDVRKPDAAVTAGADAPANDRALDAALRHRAWATDAAAIGGQLGIGAVDVRADDGAGAVADAHGARGVALGNVVYLHPERTMPGTPEGREVLAHELVHLAQARLPTDADAGRDAAEHEAAELARAIVRGGDVPAPRFAIDLTRAAADNHAPKAAAPSGSGMWWDAMVKATTPTTPDVMVNARDYLAANAEDVLAAIGMLLAELTLPDLTPRLAWDGTIRFRLALAALFSDHLQPKPEELASRLIALTRPAPLTQLIDDARVLKATASGSKIGSSRWQDSVGAVIADALEAAIGESLRRLGPRYLACVDDPATEKDEDGRPAVRYEQMIAAHDVDRFVGRALCTPGAVVASTGKQKHPHAAPKLGRVKVTWLTDPALWNWIKVDPPGATPEEVASELWIGDSEVGSYLAMWLTAVPPYYAVHPSQALRFAEARDRRPVGPDIADDQADNFSLPALAARAVGDEAAVTQASDKALASLVGSDGHKELPKGADPIELGRVAVGDCDKQLASMVTALAPWGLAPDVLATQQTAARIRTGIENGGPEAAAWARVAIVQQHHLHRISGSVAMIVEPFGANAQREGRVFELLADYVRAAVTAHFAVSGKELLALAARRQALLASEMTMHQLRGATTAVDDMTEASTAEEKSTANTSYDDIRDEELAADRERWTQDAAALAVDARQLRADTLAGKKTDPDQVADVALRAEELQLAAHFRALRIRVRELERVCNAIDSKWLSQVVSAFDGEIPSLSAGAMTIWNRVDLSAKELDYSFAQSALDRSMPPAAYAAAVLQLRRDAVASAREGLEMLGGTAIIAKFLTKGYEVIEDHQFRMAIVQVALMIGVSIAGSMAGAWLGGVVTDALGTGALANGAGLVANLATDAMITTTGNAVISGEPISGWDFLENFIANALTAGLLHAFHGAANRALDVEKLAEEAWTGAGRARRFAVNAILVTGDMVIGIAIGHLSHRVTNWMRGRSEPPSEKTMRQWLLEGASMGVGRFVHGHVERMNARLRPLEGMRDHTLATLRGEAAHLRRDAKRLETDRTPDQHAALELMARRDALAEREREVLGRIKESGDTSARNRAAIALHGADRETSDTPREDLAGMAMAVGNFREVVPGSVFEGPAEQIGLIVGRAKAYGLDVVGYDPVARRWTVKCGDQTVHFDETGPAAKAPELAGRRTKKPSEGEVAENLRQAALARVGNRARSEQLGALTEAATVDGHVMQKFGHVIVGKGPAAAMDANSLPGASRGEHPEPLASLPDTIAVGTGDDTFTKLGNNPMGQRAPETDGAAYAIQPSRFTTNHDDYASAEVISHATAVTQYRSGVPVLDGMIVEVSMTPDATWQVQGANVRIKVRTKAGDRYLYAESADIATGLGQHKELELDSIKKGDSATAAEYKQRLERSQRLVYGDEPLGQRGGTILVSGGGPTAAWNGEVARRLDKNSEVDWIARPGTDEPRSEAAHAEFLENKARLESGTLSVEEAQTLTERQAELIAFDSAKLPRNTDPDYAAFNDPRIKRTVKEITSVTPTEDIPGAEPGKVYVEFSDRSKGTYDQIVVAHGPKLDNPAEPGPAGALTLATGIEMQPVVEDGEVVALESVDPPGAVRVVGSAMWSYAWSKRIPAEADQVVYLNALMHQATSGPRDSPTPGLLHHAAKQIPAANNLKAHPPTEDN